MNKRIMLNENEILIINTILTIYYTNLMLGNIKQSLTNNYMKKVEKLYQKLTDFMELPTEYDEEVVSNE